MVESEKRGRGVVARRQQQPYATPSPQNTNHQYRSKRKTNDFIMGVAAGLSAMKNNRGPTSGGFGQAGASSGVLHPNQLDFTFRDRTDVTAKRRFQVKVPCRLMVILACVFVVIPTLIIIHKELHMKKEYYGSHYKKEQYIIVDTEKVWEKFRLAMTTDEVVHHEVGANVTTSQQQNMILEEYHSINITSNLQNANVTKTDTVKNQTNPLLTTTDNQHHVGEEIIESGTSSDISSDDKSAHDDDSSSEVNS